MGLLLAAIAVLGWGVGDFLIQRSARKLGDWEALFFITLFATVVLFPFVYGSIQLLSAFDWLVLTATSGIILVAALFDFEALRIGKISVVEPVYAMEVPITIALATLIIGERLSIPQLALIGALLVGIFLVSNKRLGRMQWKTIEKGVWFAALATVGMGVANFLFGFSARLTSPLMINWFTSAFMAVATLAYLLWRGRGLEIIASARKNASLIVAVSCADNLAWVAFSASMLFLPIGLVTGMTESYIALAALLGIFFNREKLRWHQQLGLALSIGAVVALAFTST